MIITQARAMSVIGANVMGAAHRTNKFSPVWFHCQDRAGGLVATSKLGETSDNAEWSKKLPGTR
jgi:hypothetical protein